MIENNLILITGPPRSGTSATALYLSQFNIFTGDTKGGDKWNKYGYFENRQITDLVVDYLRSNDKGLGKKFQPVDFYIPRYNFKFDVIQSIISQGLGVNQLWIYKDPKIALTWRLWNHHFPNAKWITTDRKIDSLLASYSKVPFMDAYSTEEEWLTYIDCFRKNINSIQENCNAMHHHFDNYLDPLQENFKNLCDFVGVEFRTSSMNVIDKNIITYVG